MNKDNIPHERIDELFKILHKRFVENMNRHEGIRWEEVQVKLENNPKKLWSINEMEETAGEPDIIGYDKETSEFVICDCSPESPTGRRSVCYDKEALESRKKHKPLNSAVGMAEEMGVELMNEQEYRSLQTLGNFDTKTSSWIATPADIRTLGGAIFGDCRFDQVFIYHNGAESYYAGRGFRVILRV